MVETKATDTPGYYRIQLGQTRLELVVDWKDLHQFLSNFGPWSGITPDGSPLFDELPQRLPRDDPHPLRLARLAFAPFRGSQTTRRKNNTKRIPIHPCLLLSRPIAH